MAFTTPTGMNRFSIRDIENLTGIKAHTIRIWEQRYGILKPKRTPTNIRYYDAQDLKDALRISLLNSFGYKISRIHQMTERDMSALIAKIGDSNFKLQVAANGLLEAALAMDVMGFEEMVNAYIMRHGMEATMEGLLFQFLQKVGIMWMTNNLVIAQEHLASNVLYRKLALAIESLPLAAGGNPVLLFLPEGEIHELSLMYVQYLLRKSGKLPIYLGANCPLKEVQAVYNAWQPKWVYTHLTSVARDFDGPKYICTLSEALKGAQILVSGPAMKKKSAGVAGNVRMLHSLAEVRDIIPEL